MPAYLREHRNGSGVSVVFIHGETHEQVVAGPILDIIQANEIRLACDKVELHVIQAETGNRKSNKRTIRRRRDQERSRPD